MKYTDFLWFVEATTTQRIYFFIIKSYLTPQNISASHISEQLNLSIQSTHRILTSLCEKKLLFKGERRGSREYSLNFSALPDLFEYAMRYYYETDLRAKWIDRGKHPLLSKYNEILLKENITEDETRKFINEFGKEDYDKKDLVPNDIITFLKETRKTEYDFFVSLAIILNATRTSNSGLACVKVLDPKLLQERFKEFMVLVKTPEFSRLLFSKVLNTSYQYCLTILFFLNFVITGIKDYEEQRVLQEKSPSFPLLLDQLRSDIYLPARVIQKAKDKTLTSSEFVELIYDSEKKYGIKLKGIEEYDSLDLRALSILLSDDKDHYQHQNKLFLPYAEGNLVYDRILKFLQEMEKEKIIRHTKRVSEPFLAVTCEIVDKKKFRDFVHEKIYFILTSYKIRKGE